MSKKLSILEEYEEYRRQMLALLPEGDDGSRIPEFQIWKDFYRTSPKLVKAYRSMLLRKESNRTYREQESNTVFDVMTGQKEQINPIYLQRNEATKELRKKLTDYTGCPEYVSDRLFEMKKQADLKGKNFGEVADAEVAKMKGAEIPEPIMIERITEAGGATEPLRFCNACIPRCAGHKRYVDEPIKATWFDKLFRWGK